MHTPLVERLANKYADGDYAGFVNEEMNKCQWVKWENLGM